MRLELNTSMKPTTSQRKIEANKINSAKGGEVNRNRAIEKYLSNPNRCLHCNVELPYERRKNKFCCQSHAAIHNNTGRIKVERNECAYCGKPTLRKYCSKTCSANGSRKYTPEEAVVVRKSRVREVSANYRAKLRDQTPEDVDRKAIQDFYANCPVGYEVDHIVPISKGGLHTLENLQYLTIKENRSKGSKIVGTPGGI